MSKMILIIEDEESIQNIIKAFLEDAGYTVALAADGLEGIEQFRENKPDLVLLDLMLPKVDGLAVCEILRKESHRVSTLAGRWPACPWRNAPCWRGCRRGRPS